MFFARWTIVLPISRTAQWMKDLRGRRVLPRPKLPKEYFLAPFSQEVVNFARGLSEARAAAKEEARRAPEKIMFQFFVIFDLQKGFISAHGDQACVGALA